MLGGSVTVSRALANCRYSDLELLPDSLPLGFSSLTSFPWNTFCLRIKIKQQIASTEPFCFKLVQGVSKQLDVASNCLDLVIHEPLIQVIKTTCKKHGCGLPTNENLSYLSNK